MPWNDEKLMKTVAGVLHQIFISLWYSKTDSGTNTIITVKEGDAR
jgi:hypothetical protein